MPRQMVSENRRVYKHRFSRETLRGLKDRHELPAHLEIEGNIYGFEGYKIYVDLSETVDSSEGITSACAVWHDTDANVYHGFIRVAKGFSEHPVAFQKYVLAHEWLHVMLAFREKRPFKLVAGKTDMIVKFFTSSGYSDKSKPEFLDALAESYWKDSPATIEILTLALNELLVSKESVSQILSESDLEESDDSTAAWLAFKARALSIDNSFDEVVFPLIMVFSRQTGTGAQLVFKRVREMLFQED